MFKQWMIWAHFLHVRSRFFYFFSSPGNPYSKLPVLGV